jgi:hypothetical protein
VTTSTPQPSPTQPTGPAPTPSSQGTSTAQQESGEPAPTTRTDSGPTPSSSQPSPSPSPSSTLTSADPGPAPTTPQASGPTTQSSQSSSTPKIPVTTTSTMAPTFVASGTETPTLVAATSTSSGIALVFYTLAPEPRHGLSTAATAGIGVGAGIGAIALLGGLGFLIWRWRKRSVDDAVSRAAGGTATPATTARDSEFFAGGQSRTPVSYAGFEEKVVSPHTSTAGSPPVVTAYPVAAPPPAHLSEVSATASPHGSGYYAQPGSNVPVAAAGRHQSWTSSSGYGTAVGGAPGSPRYEGGGYPIHETGGYDVNEAGGYGVHEAEGRGGGRGHYSQFSEELPAEPGYGYGDAPFGGHGPAQEFDAGRRHLSGELPGDDGPAGWRPPHRG